MRTLPFEYAARNLGRAPVRLLLSIGGSTLVVLLVLASAAFVTGMKRSLRITGSDHNVIILGSGSEESIERSEIDPRVATIVAASVGGVRTRLNVPYVSPEIHLALTVAVDEQDDQGVLTVIRGVDSRAFLVHQQVRIVEGRVPEAGRDEIMVGRLVASKIGVDEQQLGVGSTLWIDGRPWTVSARFEAPQTVMDAEIWCPLTDLQIVAQRDSLSCVVVQLGSAELGDVQAFASQRLDLEITAMSERDYYRSLTTFYGPIRFMVLFSASLVALGGIFGGLNTMYAAFASRVRELGTLQVLGYGRTAIVLSLVQESAITAAIGSIIGISLGLWLLDGVAVRFSMGAFGLIVDHGVVLVALLAGLILGVVGALPPAFRCLRLPVTEALKRG
ncbi:MAG: ABC transporter permease [Planctomycetota bacterium]